MLSTWYMVLGTWYMVLSTQYSVLGTQYTVLVTQYVVLSMGQGCSQDFTCGNTCVDKQCC